MTPLAFLCTGTSEGWDPLCNGDHLALLIVVGVVVGLALAALGARDVSLPVKFLTWIVIPIACVVLSVVVGFSLG